MLQNDRPGLRLWPALLILGLAAALLGWIWVTGGSQRQGQVLATLGVGVLTGLLLLLWLVLASRLHWKARLAGTGVLGALLVAAVLTLEVRDVTGDVLPLLAWRWSPRPGEVTPAMQHAGPATAPPGAVAAPSPDDYPQFLGPRRDATVRDVHLARDWSATPPRRLWRQRIGAGWSGFAVVGDHAVTHEQRDDHETVTAYDVRSGALLWAHGYAARFDDPLGGVGPRATPAIDGGRVFALGATGVLTALDLATGQPLWTRRIVRDNRAAVPTYGVSASPLALDGKVVVSAGGTAGRSLVAYDQVTGERLWSGGDGPAAYSSPMLAELAGERQILILNEAGLAAHDPDTGAVLWTRRWPSQTQKASQPVVLGDDRVFVSTGYGIGGKLFRVRRGDDGGLAIDLVWESTALKAKFTNVLQREGQLYGLDDGILACVDAATGERRWKGGRYGHGQVMLIDDLILVVAENGQLALVEAKADSYRELSRLTAVDGKTWNHPALAGRHLLVRNDREAACYELPVRR